MALFDDTFAPYAPFGSRTLRLGAVGTDVAVLQAVYNLMLESMNPPGGPMGSPITIDGHYGSATQQAVRSIESYFGLAVDGIAGPDTFFVYGQGVGPHTTYGGPVYGSRQLETGAQGGDVTILQNRLNAFRYASIIGHPASGSFDAATAHAVLAFKHDARATGDTGFPDNSIAGFGFYDATWLYTFAGGRAIQAGRNGFDVVYLQALLSFLRYYSGRRTGYYDAATQTAVRNFQRAQGITQDGVVGPVTFYQLGRQGAQTPPSPLGIAWPPEAVPTVSLCSVPLVSQLSRNLHPYGMASIVVNEAEGFQSLDVVGNVLPPPSSFGSYTLYVFTLTYHTTVIRTAMTMLPPGTATGESDWGGSMSVGVATIPKGVVTVSPARSLSGPVGPTVLAGNLANCN